MLSRFMRLALGKWFAGWLGNWVVRAGLRLIITPEEERQVMVNAEERTNGLLGARILHIRHYTRRMRPTDPPSIYCWIGTDKGCLELGSPFMEFRCDLTPEEVSRCSSK